MERATSTKVASTNQSDAAAGTLYIHCSARCVNLVAQTITEAVAVRDDGPIG